MNNFYPELQNSTLAEQLTDNFYEWEKRGRGWDVWDYSVALEPPFVPFFNHTSQKSYSVTDDTHQPGLFEKIDPQFKNVSNSEDEIYIKEAFNKKPQKFSDNIDLKGLTISLSGKEKISVSTAEQLLLNLSYCSYPISFEIVGSQNYIQIQFTCREPDFPHLKQQLQAYFPEIVISEENETMGSLWNTENNTAIVDFALSHEFMRPLSALKSFETDPLIGIIGALENLKKDEIGIFQVMFQKVNNPWSESILRSVLDSEGRSFFADAPEMATLAKEKVKKPLFAVIIRVAGQSPKDYRSWEIARQISSGLTLLSDPQSNELIPLSNDEYDDRDHITDLFYCQTHRSGMLLNSEELVSLVHPPSSSIHSKKLVRELKKSKTIPPIALNHKTVLGVNRHQGQESSVTLSTEQRLRHMYVIGATGTGKTTLLLNMIIQDMNNGLGVCVLDPHGDLVDTILGHVPDTRIDDVVVLDPSDTEYPVGLNILSAHSDIEKNVLSSDLVDVFKRLSTSWGDQMTSVLGNALLAFLESDTGGTLIELRRFLVEPTFRNTFLKSVKDPEIVYYWQKQFPMLRGNSYASILTRLDTFLRPKLVRNMVAQKKGINFQDILENKKICLVKLPQGLIGEENTFLLGSLIVSKLHQVTMARQAKTEDKRDNFFLYLDEFQNFITPSMSSILSGARKYGLGLVLAHQELRQLWNQDTEVANSAISNPYIRVCFRLGDFDAKKLEDGFSYFNAGDLQNIGVGEAICRIERKEFDFNIKTANAPVLDPDIVKKRQEEIINLSRQKYAKSREEVERVVESHLKPVFSSEEPIETIESQITSNESPVKLVEPSLDNELSGEERVFIEAVAKNPLMFVTHIYKKLGFSGYKGDKIKESLIGKGFIVQKETRAGKKGRLAKVLELTGKGNVILEKSPLKGKGGLSHKHLQLMFKEQAVLYGWKAQIEEKITGTSESVDVGLLKDDIKVAIEISSTTKADQEAQNIRKCLNTGYDYIICVSSEEKQLLLMKKEVRSHFTIRERGKIKFFAPSEVKSFLSAPSKESNVSEKSIVSEQISSQKQLLDTKEASLFLGISKNTLYEWVIQKKIPHIKVGRLTKFKKEALEEWLNKRTQEERRDIF